MYTHEFMRLWYKISKEMKLHLETELGPSLTEGQLHILDYIRHLEKIKPSDLLDFLSTTPAAITTILDRMEKNGLIQRDRDEKDRRIVWVTVTPKGLEECERGLEIRNLFLDSVLSRISSHNQQLLVYLLGKVAN